MRNSTVSALAPTCVCTATDMSPSILIRCFGGRMTGIPDAVVEAVVKALDGVVPGGMTTDLARAALEAAEGPWREHLATQTCCPCPRHSHQCTSHCQEDAR